MAGEVRVFVGRFGRVALLERTPTIAEHAHAQAHALMKVSGIDTVFRVEGRDQVLDAGSVVLINPWASHAGRPLPDGATAQLLALYIAPYWFERSIQAAIALGRCRVFAAAKAPLAAEVRAAAGRMLALMRDDTAEDAELDRACEALFRSVLTQYGTADLGETARAATRPSDFRVRRAIVRMREAPGITLDIDGCAAVAGLSRSRFFELFRSCTGVSPRVYANALCIETAIELLGTTEAPIHAIAERLGFSAPGHFTRFFLQHLGSTPRAFRNGVRRCAAGTAA
ncbi:helix-turn-helix domain-containing protein [Rhodoplanes serenus]|jgi:AraC-like DNA-binding protein|uniref:Helix-turn-helix domain-containing protein n=1 Tax=Rhodoplanes serenus TaxID=200615 RepID=A0A9X4XRF3_9BRAD|nr:AraC family transcriptional regulator [Rhodoplanes serenus]MTW18951.1 helix-turn-helix domain-containing protein [Rhodoplanes serenus]